MRSEVNVEKLRKMNVDKNRTDVENVLLKEMIEYDVKELLTEADEAGIDAIIPENIKSDSLFGDVNTDNALIDSELLDDSDDLLGDFNMVEL